MLIFIYKKPPYLITCDCMKKGQFSFDFIFALIIMLLLTSSLAFFANEFNESQQKVALKMQIERLSPDIAAITAYQEFLNSTTDYYEYFYTLPFVKVKNELGHSNFYIESSADTIKIRLDETHVPEFIESGEPIESEFKCAFIDSSSIDSLKSSGDLLAFAGGTP